MTLLDPVRLKAALGALAVRFDVDALDRCASTNDEIARRAAANAPSGTVVVADRQSAGRGRRGRHWLSAPESSLTFSMLWRFGGSPSALSGLSLAVGVALARREKAALFLVDRLDILHPSARPGVLYLLRDLGVPCLVGMTAKDKDALPALESHGLGRAVWIENGAIGT